MKTKNSIANRTACAATRLPVMLLLLMLPAPVQAQFDYTINNGTITITGYTGPGGAVTIPDMIDDLPVTSIGAGAFGRCNSLTSVSIPNTVTSVGTNAFLLCSSLTNVLMPSSVTSVRPGAFYHCGRLASITIPDSVTSIEQGTFSTCGLTSMTIPNSVTNIGMSAFGQCSYLTNVTIGNSVTSIGNGAFLLCGLTSVTIGNSVASIGDSAFWACIRLQEVYFRGNAPTLVGSDVFYGASNATAYHLPGTTGWGATFGGRPTALWKPQVLTSDDSFGVRTNHFGFTISWASGMTVAADACTNLSNPLWIPLQTNTLLADTLYFSDPHWTNYPARFYRLRWP